MLYFGYESTYNFGTLTNPDNQRAYTLSPYTGNILSIKIVDGFGPVDDACTIEIVDNTNHLQSPPDIVLIGVGEYLYGPYDIQGHTQRRQGPNKKITTINGKVDGELSETIFQQWVDIRAQVHAIIGTSGDINARGEITNRGLRDPYRYFLTTYRVNQTIQNIINPLFLSANDLNGLRSALDPWGLTIAAKTEGSRILTQGRGETLTRYLHFIRKPFVDALYPINILGLREGQKKFTHDIDNNITGITTTTVPASLTWTMEQVKNIKSVRVTPVADKYNSIGKFKDRQILIQRRQLNSQPFELVQHKSGNSGLPIRLASDPNNLARAGIVVDLLRWRLQNTSAPSSITIPGKQDIVPHQILTLPIDVLPYRSWRITSVRHDIMAGRYTTTLELALWQGPWVQGAALESLASNTGSE